MMGIILSVFGFLIQPLYQKLQRSRANGKSSEKESNQTVEPMKVEPNHGRTNGSRANSYSAVSQIIYFVL